MVRCRRIKQFYLLFMFPFTFILCVVLTSGTARGAEGNTGEKLFEQYCAVCHGVKGDAKGQVCFSKKFEESGRAVINYPRDFTVGVFKFRTTPTGCLPTDDDLMRTINNGIAPAFMPLFKDMSLKSKNALLSYIKSFSTRWEEEEPCKAITVRKPEWVGKPASVERGKQVYEEMKCWECHGYEGKGDGPKSDKLKDDWGVHIVPFDFTTGNLKRGTSPENIYTTYITGLDGTGMPSYEDSIKNEEDRWHLVSYTLKLMKMAK